MSNNGICCLLSHHRVNTWGHPKLDQDIETMLDVHHESVKLDTIEPNLTTNKTSAIRSQIAQELQDYWTTGVTEGKTTLTLSGMKLSNSTSPCGRQSKRASTPRFITIYVGYCIRGFPASFRASWTQTILQFGPVLEKSCQ